MAFSFNRGARRRPHAVGRVWGDPAARGASPGEHGLVELAHRTAGPRKGGPQGSQWNGAARGGGREGGP